MYVNGFNHTQHQDGDEVLVFWIFIIVVLIVYIVSPHDLVSEAHYGIVGLIDDVTAAIILVHLIVYVMNAISPAIITLLFLVFLVRAQMSPSSSDRK